MGKRLVIFTVLAAVLAFGQKVDLGVVGGFGGVAVEDNAGGGFGMFGAEVCAFSSSRFALFGEYHHWERAGGTGEIKSADLAAGGLRVQGRGRVRPFFDVGLGGGRDHYTVTFANAPGEIRSHDLWGLALGGGVAIHIGKRFYLRPQVRTFALSGLHFFTAGAVGFGYRF